MIRLTVHGIPQAQGSKKAFVVGGRAHVTESGGAKHATWRQEVTAVAQQWRDANPGPLLDGPLSVTLTFWLPKPASAKKAERWAWKKPDLDKLTRAILDSLTGTIWVDDSRVVAMCVKKPYAIDSPPGVDIVIGPIAALMADEPAEAAS